MNEAEAALVRLSASLASRDRERIAASLRAAKDVAPDETVEEAILQSYLFLGYPVVLQALQSWRALAPLAEPRRAEGLHWEDWAERGERVCGVVYAGQYGRLRRNVAELHPDLERWMVVEGYGKVLGRPALPLRTRELCIVALLAAQDAREQLYSHLRGALNAGASGEQVRGALEIALADVPPERSAIALDTWRRVLARRQPGTAGAVSRSAPPHKEQ